MKKYFTRFMAVVCCLLASVTANAQYGKVLEAYPSGYTPTLDATFDLSSVAATLGTDATTLATALNGEWSSPLFFLEDAEGTRYSDYTQGSNGGFWMTAQGTPTGWTGDVGEDVWYNILAVDEEENTFTISIGQHPDALTGGEELKAKFVLAFNEKEAVFDITLKIKKIDIPDTPNKLSELNIIEKMSTEVHQYARSSNYSEPDTVDFKGIATKLGTTPETLSVGIARIAFATTVDESDELGLKSDELTNVSTATTPGWWFDTTNDTPIYSTFVAKSSGVFVVDGFTFDPDTEELIFNVGQKGGALPIDGSDQGLGTINEVSTPIYFVYDGKAVELTVKLIIDERDKVPFNEMTEVGSEDVNLEQYPTSNYEAVSFSVDLDAIAALLEVDATEITLWAPLAANEITDESSAGNQGFWFNKDGYRASWGSGCGIFVENPTSGDYSRFNVGQYPNTFEGGETGVATIYFVAGTKYYTVHVNMAILVKEGPEAKFESVAERAVIIQTLPSTSAYPIEMRYDIDPAELELLIGTTAPTLYARKAPAEAGSPWAEEYDDRYSCTPYPGFWMSKDGYRSTWGTTDTNWGFSYLTEGSSDLNKDGVYQFEFFQMPGRSQVGDVYKAVVYLVNDATGKMVSYNMTIKFVENIVPQAEVVAQVSLTLPVKNNGDTTTTIDVSEVLQKIGFKDASQLFAVPTVSFLTSEGAMSDPAMAGGGSWITKEGVLDTDPDGTNAALGIVFLINTDTEITATVYDMVGGWDADAKIISRFGFQNDGKIYIFNVTFIAEEVLNGIHEAPSLKADAVLYDLSGRPVRKSQQGIYIQNGKKVVVR